MPAGKDPTRQGASTMTREERDDVVRARQGVRHAGVTFGPPQRRRSVAASWHDFAARYGWRAYAVPVLLVVTIAALLSSNEVRKHVITRSAPHQKAGPPVASASFTLKNDAAAGRINDSVLKAAALPAGPVYTVKGAGTFHVLKGTSPVVGKGHLYRYSIEVENGIKDVDLTQYANLVVTTLSDPRSWSGHGVALKRVDSGPIDFRVSLTTSMTVRNLCGYDIKVETSCYAPAGGVTPVNRVVFNLARWVRGSAAYVGDLATYRIYMINHEDGHAMGHQHAHQCLPGGLAPVMMQQTFGLRSASTGKICEANPWPYPAASAGAPGAEQPDTAANNEFGLGD
ncbi:MAG: DUF3152 domain-containing protein [Jatrophihabitans sp.]|uniref:DUF3152 domain-containing protein n=1 Tax=Jatrophihabitans sp. TaxID=1932789 RepID=UPI0039152B1E